MHDVFPTARIVVYLGLGLGVHNLPVTRVHWTENRNRQRKIQNGAIDLGSLVQELTIRTGCWMLARC